MTTQHFLTPTTDFCAQVASVYVALARRSLGNWCKIDSVVFLKVSRKQLIRVDLNLIANCYVKQSEFVPLVFSGL